MDHGFTVPICKRPAKEPVEEEDKAAQEKERAMAACAKVSKVDCKYFKPHKHKARTKKKGKTCLKWGIRYTSQFLTVRFELVFFWLMVCNSCLESLNYQVLKH